MDSSFVYGELTPEGGVKTPGEVLYPFGYGLSYTTFDQEIVGYRDGGSEIELTVKVTNTGKVAGKDVVQVYYSAPYTDLDRELKIEKPTANLIEFAKTGVIAAGKSEEVEISFPKEAIASYCYTRDNGDGTKGCYMLEEGEYLISVRNNSHDVLDSRTWKNFTTIWYDTNNPRQLEKDMQALLDDEGNPTNIPANGDSFIAATNRFEDSNAYMTEATTMLSRVDWKNTFPEAYPNREKTLSEKFAKGLGSDLNFDYENDPVLGNVSTSKVYSDAMPASKQDNGLSVSDLRGKDFNDPTWDLLLDQIDYDADKANINQIIGGENYFTERIESIELSPSVHCEGFNGVRMDNKDMMDLIHDVASGGKNFTKSASFGASPNFATTWNTELLEKVGEALGQEAFVLGLNGRYSPAFNLHRSPFIGRVNEYFSEDPVVSGKAATAFVTGTGNLGLTDYVKHFGINDQETNRLHACTWATEQVMRELYNKPFEMVLRDARKTIKYTADSEGNTATKVVRACSGMMISQNRVGFRRSFFNYNLVTSLVREEWGFNGHIITDMFTIRENDIDQMVRAGCDSWLAWSNGGHLSDYDSATSRTAMREAIHHLAYMVANSNVMQNSPPGTIIYYKMSPWRIALTCVTVAVALFAVGMVAWMVWRVLDEKKRPEAYKHNEKI